MDGERVVHPQRTTKPIVFEDRRTTGPRAGPRRAESYRGVETPVLSSVDALFHLPFSDVVSLSLSGELSAPPGTAEGYGVEPHVRHHRRNVIASMDQGKSCAAV
ncbi:unnamed protein product [Trichogramma brassicae]|uniref:Uncharacterized protein n=1 Tax=Trichogramma brassicae TaxID=86971 RepID=A0A6H5HZQ9_9HYME|nr:unnamed protein product [Trichogramma brassicae]